MKRKTAIILGCICGLIVLSAVIYRLVNKAPSDKLPESVRVAEIFDDGGCLMCHSADPELPFYAKLPIVGKMVMKDVEKGYRSIDLTEAMQNIEAGKPVTEVMLAKIERVIQKGTMPPLKYYIIHWGSSVTPKKKEIILEWVRNQRYEHYYTGIAAHEFANEPVQPIPVIENIDLRKVLLGEALFHDVLLSSDNTISCASCHDLKTAGVDNKQYSVGVENQLGGVNAPTVFNSYFNFVQFWDGRAADLAAQAAGPPLNPIEMASKTFDEIIVKLKQNKDFTKAFLQVYPDGYSEQNITNAIGEFEKTLTTPNSRFDHYLKGDPEVLTAQEVNGYELFKKYDCATCHVGVLLGGQSYELMGVHYDYFLERGIELTNEDMGRFKETKQERDRHRFKVPQLRNVALTWPYYHDGSRATLREAVRDMGRYQSNVNLTDGEIDDIVAFLETLTGEYQGKPLTNTNVNSVPVQ